MEEAQKPSLALLGDSEQRKPQAPKRFVRSQIPDSILHDPALNAAISLLPSNYHFEVHKCVWRVRSRTPHAASLGDATYGACCVDDLAAKALNADLLIHFGHSCLVPLHVTSIPCLYVFVEISIDVGRLIQTVHLNLQNPLPKTLVLAGTIQFASAIRAAKPELEARGFKVLVPQSKPLSAGEVLGCTAPKISRNHGGEDGGDTVLVFVADGRFHLEAFMIANPGVKAFRYDPYMGKLFLEEYDHKGMRESRKSAVLRAKEK
ncbi:putative diphthamide synthesis DPH1/DPH2 [Rosa chinensis]|uniref:2-(3-amino-3-carboxypropyl)histidine synthase subunit 1 n=1 Tax=Rosa chinensis TaxID=74649 RepID=A0A2P6PE17_ROSCH|nr:putative diphthamide synthesis DPH1/DPH2 [Rosa chinensis]